MSDLEIHHVTVVGVGLIGGSIGLGVKRRWPAAKVAGVGRRQKSLDDALTAGAIDTAHLDAAEAVAQSDVVVLATPVGAFKGYLRRIAPILRPGALVTDAGSTKAGIVAAAEDILGAGGPFVGAHPMAGSEQKGVDYASADLLADALCVLTPTAHTPADLLGRAEAFWRGLGMRIATLDPADHDRAVARISHLPHVLSVLMMLLPDDADLGVAASGFRDVTRLASGDPEMWRDILTANRREVRASLSDFALSVERFRELLDAADPAAVERLLAEAKARRDGRE